MLTPPSLRPGLPSGCLTGVRTRGRFPSISLFWANTFLLGLVTVDPAATSGIENSLKHIETAREGHHFLSQHRLARDERVT